VGTHPLKRCSVCRELKPLSEFYNSKKSKDGKGYRCKPCDTIARKKWSLDNPVRSRESARNRSIKHAYGITPDDYNKLLMAQDNKCAVCGTDIQTYNMGHIKHFAVDHDHTTGKIRGLLCHNCNRSIGLLKEDPEVLRKAANYIERNR